jgi:hypothetical protein
MSGVVETLFYRPHRESVHSGVRDPDMSGLGARHVRQMSLKLGPSTGHVRCTDLTRGNADRPNMCDLGTGYVQRLPLELGDLTG